MPATPVALVTGSGKRRVGWHVAEALSRHGYALAIHYRTSEVEAEESAARWRKLGVQVLTVQADLADENAVRSLIGKTLDRFGRLDVLVNCAAIWQSQRLEDVTAYDVQRHFTINTLGTFLCSQQAGLAMTKQPEGGCIIAIGDWATARPYLNYAAYFLSKGAMATMTRCLAVELGTRNPRVRVNCIEPGPVLLPADLGAEERRQAIEATLAKREGRPENIAQAVLFLVENDFVTGVCLPIDGGRSVFAPDL